MDILDQKSSTKRITSQEHSQLPNGKPGCLNGNIHIGKNTGRDIVRMRAEPRPEKPVSRPMPGTTLAFSLGIPGRDWLMGLCPCTEVNKIETSGANFTERKDEDLSCPDYFVQRLVEAWRMFTIAGRYFTTSARAKYASKWLVHMIRHTSLTLHHSSPAMQIIGTSNSVSGEYISAMVSVLLAVLYLLVLLNILIALGKTVKLIGKTLWFIWVPIRVAVLLLKWCIFS